MNVAQLIAVLQNMNPTRLVVLQKDSEGNGYSPLAGADETLAYVAALSSESSGEAMKQMLTDEDRAAGFSEEDLAPSDAVPCVVLYPR